MELVEGKAKLIFLVVVLSFIGLEFIWSLRKQKAVYNKKEVWANFGIMLGNQLLKPIRLGWFFFVFALVEPYALFELPNHWLTTVAVIILVDFIYYWHHRLSHEVKLLWTLHNVHHSSPWMNFTTALRLNWLNFIFAPLFFIPVLLLGFSMEQTAIFFILNLFYQFFLHTEAIGKIPFLEGWMNTPSAHRVHHGSNTIYIDKNYGGLFMVWDRIFGTYQAETEKVNYGVTTGFEGHNPAKLVLKPLYNFFKGTFKREREHIQSLEQETQQAQTDVIKSF